MDIKGVATGAAIYGYIIGTPVIGAPNAPGIIVGTDGGGSSKLMRAESEAGTSSPNGLITFGLISSTGVNSEGI